MLMAGIESPDAGPGLIFLKPSSRAIASKLVCLEAEVDEIRLVPIPTTDAKGDPINTPRERLWAVNDLILKHEDHIGTMTTCKNDSISKDEAKIPEGCLVFEALQVEDKLGKDALRQLQDLYRNESNPKNKKSEITEALQELQKLRRDESNPDTKISAITDEKHAHGSDLHFLFYSKKSPIYIEDVLNTLEKLKYRRLHEFILMHYKAIQNSLGATDIDMKACSLTFVKYSNGRGLIAHIDGIKDFRDTFGPIFTIAMGEGMKRLDLLPVATNEGEHYPPVRLFTQQFEITMLQGCARAAYAHSVPFGVRGNSEPDQYTIAFKFPAIQGGNPGPSYHCDKLNADVPTIVMQTGAA